MTLIQPYNIGTLDGLVLVHSVIALESFYIRPIQFIVPYSYWELFNMGGST